MVPTLVIVGYGSARGVLARRGSGIADEGRMKMALVGKSALVADVGNIIPGAQPRFGVLHAGDVEEAARRQAGVLPEGANQRLLAQREALGKLVEGRRAGEIGKKCLLNLPAGCAKRVCVIRAMALGRASCRARV